MIIIGAIAIIFKVETRYTLGIIFGMLAALTSSFFTVFNGLLVQRISSPVIAIYELGGGFLALTVYLLFTNGYSHDFFSITPVAWIWLSIFAILGTAYPFIASVNLMKKISPFTVMLTVNLETIYGIIIAYYIWKKDEAMTPAFYLGAFIILSTVFGNAILKRYIKN
jgi:drug/metabolite transporter (DMT)-like permease